MSEQARACAAYLKDHPGYKRIMRELLKKYRSYGRRKPSVWTTPPRRNAPPPGVSLAVLSAQSTSDPHALDSGTLGGRLFLYLLSFRSGLEVPENAEQRDVLYHENGILCDSISSLVSQAGLVLYTGEEEHPAYQLLRPWHMTPDDYDLCRSDVPLSEASRSLLQGCAGTVLEASAEAVKQCRRAGYQELLIPLLETDLTETL